MELNLMEMWAGMSNLVVYMGLRHLARIAARLIDAGMPADTPAAVVEKATLPGQRVIDGELATIAGLAADVSAPAVIVIGECVRVRARLLALATEGAVR